MDKTGPVVRRRAGGGWSVDLGGGVDVPEHASEDLTEAMVLADLISRELGELPAPGRPVRREEPTNETEQLRLTVTQLEHALSARVVVEQAIGVLAERHGVKPRRAFEVLRSTARSRGHKVHDLASSVVESVTDPSVTLPDALARSGRPATARPPVQQQQHRPMVPPARPAGPTAAGQPGRPVPGPATPATFRPPQP